MVTLNIDGEEVVAEPGTTVLKAAQQWGIRIPTLCSDKRLAPYGASGLCIVEVKVNGREFVAPACLTSVEDGMDVRTHSPEIIEGRRRQLRLLLRTHPLLCPTCDAAGDCKLQDLVREYEISELSFPTETRDYHVDNKSNFIQLNMNLCVKCWLCVRICDEVQGENELTMVRRGIACEVTTDFGRPLDCELCGQCAQICPVGAISSKWLVGKGREFELKKTDTVCSFCSLGCTLTLETKDENVVYVVSPPEGPNEGNLCAKGRYGWPYVYSEQRLNRPLIRKHGDLEEVEWDEALSFVADHFVGIRETTSSMGLAALGSQRLTNEEAYVFNRFVRTVLGTPHLDHAGGRAYRALVDGLAPVLGYPASTNSIREIRNAQVILLLGADLNETHPVAKNEVIMATGPMRDGTAIVVDSVRTKLCDRKGIELLTAAGSEHLIAHAMLKEIIDRGLYDTSALDHVEEGFDDLVDSLAGYSPENVGKLTGANPDLIRKAAAEYAQAPTATIILTADMNRTGPDVALAQAAAKLALVTGRIGKESCGVYVLGEKANSQGAIDMGLAPDLLPGFHNIGDESARRKFEAAWDSSLPSGKGLDARGILVAAENNQIRGLYVVGENPLETYPDRRQVIRALGGLECLVVQDMFLTSTARMAHAVLPVASFAEKVGTYTSADRRIQRLRRILEPTGPKSDLEIFQALAALMGKTSLKYAGPETVMDEIAQLVEVYGGISYHRLGKYGIVWPYVGSEDPANQFLYAKGFPNGKLTLTPAPPIGDLSSNGFPFELIPGVVKFHSGSMSQWSPSLMEVSPQGLAEMSRKDMLAMGLRDGDTIRITSSRGRTVEAKVKRSWRAVEASVIVPQHFSALGLNDIIGWEYPSARVKVEKA